MRTNASTTGFTLPEVLLAVLLFAVGLLGMASSATFIAAQVGDARRLMEAAIFTGARLDSLRATTCMTATSGSASFAGGAFAWTVASAPQTRAVRATLTAGRPGRTQSYAFDTLLPCEQ